MSLSFAQLERLWVANGGNPKWAPLMAGVAIAESGGTPTAAWNTTRGSTASRADAGAYGATGLWQIEWPSHQALQRSKTNTATRAQLFTPTVNAKLAVALFATGKGWTNWCTSQSCDSAMSRWRGAGFPKFPSAKTVQKWITGSGGTPATATTLNPFATHTPTKGGATGQTTGGNSDPCVVKISAGICLLNRSQARAVKGGLLVAVGGGVMLVSLILLAAYGIGSKNAAAQLRRLGVGGSGAQTGAQRQAQAEADAQERHATPAQQAGTPTPAGQRIRDNEWDKPFGPEDQTLKTPSTQATRRAGERRPRSPQAHRTRRAT